MKQEPTTTRAVKAAMLSGLVFPGSGQFFLGHRLRGWAFAIPTALAAIYFSFQIVDQATAVAYDILEGRMAPELGAIMESAHRISMSGSGAMNIAAGVMVACWIGSTYDAWRLGR